MGSIGYTELRQNLAAYLDQVLDSHAPVMVTRQGKGNVVLISAEEFAGMEETIHLMRSPANAERLLRSIRSAEAGLATERGLVTDGVADA